MADLQQLVGAILRDLAKARFASDLYSRSISRYYENDFLLRRFPIPRADIEAAELDLKFVISEVRNNEVNAETREANVAFLLERTVEELVAIFLDQAREYTEQPDHRDLQQALQDMLAKGFNSIAMRIELRQLVLRYFIDSYTHLIGVNGDFDSAMALRDLRRPFFWGISNYRKETVRLDDLDRPLNSIFDNVFARKEFGEVLQSLAGPIKTIWLENHDARLEVDVAGDQLQTLPDSVLSSLKLKLTIRDHVWSEVKTDEHRSTRVLTSE